MARMLALVRLLRPHHSLKNLFVLVPLFFGHKLGDSWAVLHALLAFAAFCLASSAVYVFNDLHDVAEDRAHPVKRNRPLASGAVSRPLAALLLAPLAGGGLLLAWLALPWQVAVVLAVYLALNMAYTLVLKHVAIVDVICVAAGFVLRVFAGGWAVSVDLSHWLVLMTFLLAVFLGLAKRWGDLIMVDNGQGGRRSLDGYNAEFVSAGMVCMAAVVLVSYVQYTVSPEVMDKHGTPYLYLTALWVVMGLLRYMQLALVRRLSHPPTRMVLVDPFLQIVIICWIVSFYVLLYVVGR